MSRSRSGSSERTGSDDDAFSAALARDEAVWTGAVQRVHARMRRMHKATMEAEGITGPTTPTWATAPVEVFTHAARASQLPDDMMALIRLEQRQRPVEEEPSDAGSAKEDCESFQVEKNKCDEAQPQQSQPQRKRLRHEPQHLQPEGLQLPRRSPRLQEKLLATQAAKGGEVVMTVSEKSMALHKISGATLTLPLPPQD